MTHYYYYYYKRRCNLYCFPCFDTVGWESWSAIKCSNNLRRFSFRYLEDLPVTYPSFPPLKHRPQPFIVSSSYNSNNNTFVSALRSEHTHNRLFLRQGKALWFSSMPPVVLHFRRRYTGWRKKRGHPISYSHCNYSENSMTEYWVKIGEFLQYYMLNTVINFLFKNFITLWRHLAKTQLLCDAQIYFNNVNKRQ